MAFVKYVDSSLQAWHSKQPQEEAIPAGKNGPTSKLKNSRICNHKKPLNRFEVYVLRDICRLTCNIGIWKKPDFGRNMNLRTIKCLLRSHLLSVENFIGAIVMSEYFDNVEYKDYKRGLCTYPAGVKWWVQLIGEIPGW